MITGSFGRHLARTARDHERPAHLGSGRFHDHGQWAADIAQFWLRSSRVADPVREGRRLTWCPRRGSPAPLRQDDVAEWVRTWAEQLPAKKPKSGAGAPPCRSRIKRVGLGTLMVARL